MNNKFLQKLSSNSKMIFHAQSETNELNTKKHSEECFLKKNLSF